MPLQWHQVQNKDQIEDTFDSYPWLNLVVYEDDDGCHLVNRDRVEIIKQTDLSQVKKILKKIRLCA